MTQSRPFMHGDAAISSDGNQHLGQTAKRKLDVTSEDDCLPMHGKTMRVDPLALIEPVPGCKDFQRIPRFWLAIDFEMATSPDGKGSTSLSRISAALGCVASKKASLNNSKKFYSFTFAASVGSWCFRIIASNWLHNLLIFFRFKSNFSSENRAIKIRHFFIIIHSIC